MKIRNWKRFQHYKHRKPPWIRLYRELLEDPDWINQEDEGKALLCELWMVASDTDDGSLPAIEKLAWRLRRSIDSITVGLAAINDKFLDHASAALASCAQDAPSEESREEFQKRVEERQPALDGKLLEEIPCPQCQRIGNLKRSLAQGIHASAFWCRPPDGCNANWPLTTPAIFDLMTSGARKAIQDTSPKPPKGPVHHTAAELKARELKEAGL